LHVSGLPLDVKEREVHNLFRFFPGYQGCTVKLATHSCAAFVAFATRAQALVAKEALNGIRFDLNFPYPLKIEEARQNTKSVARPPDPMSFPFSYQRLHPRMSPLGDVPTTEIAVPGTAEDYYASAYSRAYGQHYDPNEMYRYPMSSYGVITTLYINNLAPNTTQMDLESLFARMPGYRRLKLQDGPRGNKIAWIGFTDPVSAAAALQIFQGSIIRGVPVNITWARANIGDASRKRAAQQQQQQQQQEWNPNATATSNVGTEVTSPEGTEHIDKKRRTDTTDTQSFINIDSGPDAVSK
jgi:hypothetical protein